MSLPSVDQFKQQLAFGGARANYFLVSGPNIGGSEFSYLCRSAALPASKVNQVAVNAPGGRVIKMAGDRTFDDWTINVYNDTQMIMRRRFESWQAQCAQYANPLGADALDAYGQSNWVVTQLSRSGQAMRSYQFFNMWPSELTAIELNFQSTDAIEEFGVTLAYSHYAPIDGLGLIDPNVVLQVGLSIGSGNVVGALNFLVGINSGNVGGYIGGGFSTNLSL